MKDNMDAFYVRMALNLRKEREKRNLTYQQLAEKTNLSSSSLQRYEVGNTKTIPVHVLNILEDFYGLPSGYFMGWDKTEPKKDERDSGLVIRPPVRDSYLGMGAYAFSENPKSSIRLTETSVTAPDDSMLKERIKKGDKVYIAPHADIKPGDITVIRTGGEIYLCYAYKKGNTWTFASGNPGECPITSNNLKADGIAILGKVIGFRSEL